MNSFPNISCLEAENLKPDWIVASDSFIELFSFSDLTLDYLDGYFDTQNIDLGGDTIDVDLALQ